MNSIYVLDSVKDSLFVYQFASGAFVAEYALDKLNRSPRGIWSDGVTIWISDDGAKRLLAYRLRIDEQGDGTLKRIEDEEFTFRSLLKAGNGDPRGIWSNGDIVWVADAQDRKVYSYNLPDAMVTLLSALELSDVDFGEFSEHRTEYSGSAADGPDDRPPSRRRPCRTRPASR